MAKAMKQTAYQRCFAGAEIAVQKNSEAARELRAKLRAELQRRRFVCQIACKISSYHE